MSYKHDPFDELERSFLEWDLELNVLLEILDIPESPGFSGLEKPQALSEAVRILIERVRVTEGRQIMLTIPLSALRPGREYQGELNKEEDAVTVPFLEKDVHTEHCCSRCGCKYSSSDCTVVLGSLKQSYKHFHTSVCYELHPDYMRREREYRGEGTGDIPEEFSEAPDREDFPVYLASLLGVPEETSKEALLSKVKERLGLP